MVRILGYLIVGTYMFWYISTMYCWSRRRGSFSRKKRAKQFMRGNVVLTAVLIAFFPIHWFISLVLLFAFAMFIITLKSNY